MVMMGETVALGAEDPGTKLQVLKSAAGYYIGYLCNDGSPYSRESRYYASESDAQHALDNDRFGRY